MAIVRKLKKILEERFPLPHKVNLRDEDGIIGVVTSKRFRRMDMMQRQDLRNRLVRLAGSQDLQRTTAALDDAGQRLSRLFLTQLGLNAAYGVVVGVGLWFIGVPSAPLWGMLAMILRFVPYIGAVISAIFPLILAAAVGPDWAMALWTGALFLILEPVVGQIIEPLLFGHSSGLSPVAVIASATLVMRGSFFRPLSLPTSSAKLSKPARCATGSNRLSTRYCLSADSTRPERSFKSLRK